MALTSLKSTDANRVYILGYTYDEYLKLVRQFHGSEAPGVIIGGFMVDLAVRHMPAGTLYDAICETRTCLPDAIQLLTPCTIGNGWLKIIHSGRFALTLYDKASRNGTRVFLDIGRLKVWPAIEAWFLKLKTREEQDRLKIADEIRAAGHGILSHQSVTVRSDVAEKKHKGAIAVCAICGEAFPAEDGNTCLACSGSCPYL
ncbi:MAG TPA: formylmethanofuran dehydrogenase subunit E family protein [Syntrophorhabdaceae bacterium]|nr:formylmethanofuran dehydrogenase subunit E family protein [Syntrophorhabdaceae bacterium]